MTNILKALAIAATLVTEIGTAWAGAGSPYPDHFKIRTCPIRLSAREAGIPAPYRLGN